MFHILIAHGCYCNAAKYSLDCTTQLSGDGRHFSPPLTTNTHTHTLSLSLFFYLLLFPRVAEASIQPRLYSVYCGKSKQLWRIEASGEQCEGGQKYYITCPTGCTTLGDDDDANRCHLIYAYSTQHHGRHHLNIIEVMSILIKGCATCLLPYMYISANATDACNICIKCILHLISLSVHSSELRL